MKFLINANYKALRTGEFVSASESAKEFILDTEGTELSVATLLEIAAANKVAAKKDKKENILAVLEEGLSKKGLPEMSERPISETVEEIIKNGVAAGKSDDDMLIEIVQAGVKFKVAGKLFQQIMTAGGYRVSTKERKEAIRTILVGEEFQPEAYSEVAEMLTRLTKEIPDTEIAQALKGLRAYAKEFSIELPKPAKKEKGGFKSIVQTAVVNNPNFSLEEFSALCVENKKDAERCVRLMWSTIQFAKAVAQSAITLELEEIENTEDAPEAPKKKAKR